MLLSKKLLSIGLLALLALTLAAPAVAGSVNKSVHIEDGASASGASSVNGSISVGENAMVSGDVSTVNGTVRIASSASVEDVSTVNGAVRIAAGVMTRDVGTVNGSITVADNVTVDGEIEAVNGSITIDRGSTVARDVSNVNGRIELVAAQVSGDISTVNGDVHLRDAAVLRGDLIVEKPGGWFWRDSEKRRPEIVIGPGSRILGTIRLERQVKLYISEAAEVGGVTGEMTMDDAIRFSGERP